MPFCILLLCMVFCHIVDDYYLQGLLAKLKQKSYWELNAPDKMYKHDYLMALLMHSMSWSFMIMLPLLIYFDFDPPVSFMILWIINTIVHFVTDDLKANRFKINLIQDQSIHIFQIIITLIIMYYWYNLNLRKSGGQSCLKFYSSFSAAFGYGWDLIFLYGRSYIV